MAATLQAALPRVSFVLPVFNRAKTFERALLSVVREREEDYPNLEIVVIDGASKDGTAELIQKHAGVIDYWVSERDGSAAEAFNKGVQAARGDIIRYFACDDELLPGMTRRMVEYLVAHPEMDVLGARAHCLQVDATGRRVLDKAHARLTGGWMTMDEVVSWDRSGVFAYIETWFFRRCVFEQVGYLDARYRICPDVDFAFRLVKAGCHFYVLPDVIVNKVFYSDGSNLVADTGKSLTELRQIFATHAGAWQRFKFFWTYPQPLPARLFWGAWLKAVKGWQASSPSTYRRVSATFKARS
jgi:glycosyltransferase involved in cell wall biosynthesis